MSFTSSRPQFLFRMMNSFSKEKEARDTDQVLETSSGSLFDRIMKGLNTDQVGFNSASQDESFDSNEDLEKKLEELGLDSPLTKLQTSDNLISKSLVDSNLSSEEKSIKTVEKILEIDPQTEWREVKDRNSGRLYYYNRVTRETSWTLPKNGVIVGNRRSRQSINVLTSLSVSGITVESEENFRKV